MIKNQLISFIKEDEVTSFENIKKLIVETYRFMFAF
jgi:hypothetical protein